MRIAAHTRLTLLAPWWSRGSWEPARGIGSPSERKNVLLFPGRRLSGESAIQERSIRQVLRSRLLVSLDTWREARLSGTCDPDTKSTLQRMVGISNNRVDCCRK